jgi:transposase
MLALGLVLDGRSRMEAAVLCGMDRQTLRNWVHRYNDLGLAGLSSRIPPGPKPRLTSEQEAEVARLVQDGPSLSEHGVVRWRRTDLSHLIPIRLKADPG